MGITLSADELIQGEFNWRDIYYFYKKNWVETTEIKSYISQLLSVEQELTDFLWTDNKHQYDIETFLKRKSLSEDLSAIKLLSAF